MPLIDNLTKCRNALRYTPKSISDYLDVSVDTYMKYETYATSIPMTVVIKLCDLYNVYGVTLEKLLEPDFSIEVSIADRVDPQDFKSLAQFNRIIYNYSKIKSL